MVPRRLHRALTALVGVACQAAIARGAPVVEYRDERLTVHAEATPLTDVLQAVSRATGAEVQGTAPTRPVSIDLAGVPLGDALGRLLGNDSFALHYGPDGRIRTIELLARADERAPAWPPLGALPGPPDVPLTDPDRQHAVMTRPIEVTGRLAAALRTRHPAAGELIHAALREPSGKVRAEAQERLLRAFASDPELEATFAATLAPIEDANLARILRGIAGGRAEGFMAKLAAEGGSPELRAKAGAVLEALRDADHAEAE